MKIFDCFTFYNELDLLEIRLEEMWDTVDYFVIVEANTTYQSNSKSFYLKDNWMRYKKYHSKIRHILIDDMPMNPNPWVNEKFQRSSINRGLTDLSPDDIVIVSDVDEIPRSSIVNNLKNNFTKDRYIFQIPMHCFRFNMLMIRPFAMHGKIIATKGSVFTNAQQERELTFNNQGRNICRIPHAGWDFSYLGNTEFAKNKIKSFSHTETNIPNIVDNLNVEELIKSKMFLLKEKGIERFEYVVVNDYYPKSITENLEKYKDFIIPGATKTVFDFYPIK
jgi:hypothetical protein